MTIVFWLYLWFIKKAYQIGPKNSLKCRNVFLVTKSGTNKKVQNRTCFANHKHKNRVSFNTISCWFADLLPCVSWEERRQSGKIRSWESMRLNKN